MTDWFVAIIYEHLDNVFFLAPWCFSVDKPDNLVDATAQYVLYYLSCLLNNTSNTITM